MDPLTPAGGSFRSRRSYPSLQHISVAPLTSRIPLDDDPEPEDYFSQDRRDSASAYTPGGTVKTSYLSSASVPSTPPILSNSRSGSRIRQYNRSRSVHRGPLSETNLKGLDSSEPFHHHHHHEGEKRRATYRHKHSSSLNRQDPEWVLRAGLALAASTREEKGQSWLVKRDSSTSLVEQERETVLPSRHDVIGRKSRSGRATPVPASRRASRSRGGSKKGSRVDLTMTSAESTVRFNYSQPVSPEAQYFVPDFVDDHVRSEMADELEEYLSSSGSETDSEDEIDEVEMQRLTRERGFGLGSWLDRFVEWTLFSVDEEWPTPEASGGETSVTFREDAHDNAEERRAEDTEDDHNALSSEEDNHSVDIGKPGDRGGWSDATWFLRVVKNAVRDATIRPLPEDVVAKIKSSISITSLNGVILELVKNSLDADAERIKITVDYQRGGCVVEDDGHGIPPQEFERDGGLGKAHCTSKFKSKGPTYGRKGQFLGSLSALSLLTITSHHVLHDSTNSVIFHQGKPVARLLPAPPQQELELGIHGTRVSVHDLFGNIPVRVKSRALALQKPEEVDREWDDLRVMLTALMLANDKSTNVVVADPARNRKFNIRGRDSSVTRSDSIIRAMDIERVVFLLRHAGFLTSRHGGSWTSMSANTPEVSIQAAISLEPSPTKQAQFMSLGIHPIFPRNNANVLFNEVNRMFAASDFGTLGYSASDSSDTRLRSGQPVSKLLSKAVNRWPMFYIRIDTQGHDEPICEERNLLTSDNSLQHILDVLSAMLRQFLQQNYLRPRAGSRKKETQMSLDTRDNSQKASSRERAFLEPGPSLGRDRTCGTISRSTEESLDDRIVLPILRNKALSTSSTSSHFSGWSRIKSGKEYTLDAICSGLPRGKQSTSSIMSNPKDRISSLDEDIANQRTSMFLGGESSDSATLESAPLHDHSGPVDGTHIWMDPVSKAHVLINSRTGQAVPPRQSMTRPAQLNEVIRRPHSASFLQDRISNTEKVKRPASALPTAHSGWLDNMMKRWDNPVLSRWERPITTVDPVASRQAERTSIGSSHHCSIFSAEARNLLPFKGRLSKVALQRAEVIAQIDRKFILIKMAATPNLKGPGSVLTIVDQHAADERCRVEKLFDEFFLSAAGTGDTGQRVEVHTTELLPPIIFETSAAEFRLLRKYSEFFTSWGCHYEPSKASETRGGKFCLRALPTGIVERCRMEPTLAIDMLRSEIWKREETGKNISGGNTKRSSVEQFRKKGDTGFTPSDQDEIVDGDKRSFWVERIADCPQGILDLLNSRACRSAIMFNDQLALDECRNLVTRLSRCVFPFQCAHGRPTMIPILDFGSQVSGAAEFASTNSTTDDSRFEWKSVDSTDGLGFADAFKAWRDTLQ
ncbi:DNA mismatch repair protein (Mlh3), putative [Paecilomyces variotii No. 5]|uniref:DNA mismatch repair protein (Mlh3), putative n=1 Tax=Byssochlamys spectabilis (strain No. 5 / NBRC 109023) TaxID=1356009 RepID=V5FP41_BYSSN|nr:DNA mismatch repair protein (Mlh3), putative [Paecilomyces variotii No. 5]